MPNSKVSRFSIPAIVRRCLRAASLIVVGDGLNEGGAPRAWATDVLPESPPLCAATFGDAGGQDADFDLLTNSAFSQADGGFLTENSSNAEIGLDFVPVVSFPATVQMGVTFNGLLVGSLGINTIFGEVRITVTLRDVTAGVDVASEVIHDEKEDGAAFQTIFNVVTSDQLNPPVASFENVDLIAGHTYSVTLRVVTTAQGVQGESDFKTGDRVVQFGCVTVTAELVDSDGDGLYDDWEENGIHVDDDGVVDIDLPAFGARSDHKDLFVEMDWRPGRQPKRAGILAVKEAFALAPIDAGGTVNPDGQPGINLWIDTGGAMEDGSLIGDDLGGGGDDLPDEVICLGTSFYAAKADFFDPIRLLAFRYAISGDPDENTCSNGQSVGGKGEKGGNDFIFYNIDPGFIFHELGHTLNLGHGGFEDLNNKPNYVSMMNYNYGLTIPRLDGTGVLDYAPALCSSCPGGRDAIPGPLDESQLDETMVLDPNDGQNMFVFRDVLAVTTTAPMSGQDLDGDAVPDGIDWDGDGAIDNSSVVVDINEDGKCVSPGGNDMSDTDPEVDDVLLSDTIIHDGPNRTCDTTADPMSDDGQSRSVGSSQPDVLSAHDDWGSIILNPREFGEDADAPINEGEERSLEEWRAADEEINTTNLEIVKSDLPDPVNAGEPLVYTLTVINHGPQPARGIRVVDVLPAEATYVSDNAGCTESPPGTLTCQLPTLLVGDSTSFEISVVVAEDAVADLPAPVVIDNLTSVVNRVQYGFDGSLGEVGGDPDPSDNDDSETTTINRPPVADPNGPYVEECQGPVTMVQLDGSASFDPDGDPITYEWSTDCPSAAFDVATSATPILSAAGPPPCPVECTATLTVTDPMDLSDTESTGVTIEDTTPPSVTIELTPSTLWPPNHQLVDVTATVAASDICDPSPAFVLTSITSDEPDDATGGGDGNTVGDIQGAAVGTPDLHFQLRAERAGSGDGRTYTVTYTVTDACGLSTDGQAEVVVPHDNKK